jgi:hypothetical protein
LVDVPHQQSHRTGSHGIDRCSSVAIDDIQTSAATNQKIDDTSMVSFDGMVDSRFPSLVPPIQ